MSTRESHDLEIQSRRASRRQSCGPCQRLQKYTKSNAEQSGHHANAERHRENRKSGKAAITSQRTQPISQIIEEACEPGHAVEWNLDDVRPPWAPPKLGRFADP